eukprot:RCo041180
MPLCGGSSCTVGSSLMFLFVLRQALRFETGTGGDCLPPFWTERRGTDACGCVRSSRDPIVLQREDFFSCLLFIVQAHPLCACLLEGAWNGFVGVLDGTRPKGAHQG